MNPKTILLADDDQALTKALSIRCKELNVVVKTSPDGLHAYQQMLQDPPDLLVLDVNMPGAGGLYMCEELAQDERFSSIPIIILTGKSDEATVQRCERLGAHYAWKGLETWQNLKPLIRDLLKLEEPEADQAAANEVAQPNRHVAVAPSPAPAPQVARPVDVTPASEPVADDPVAAPPPAPVQPAPPEPVDVAPPEPVEATPPEPVAATPAVEDTTVTPQIENTDVEPQSADAEHDDQPARPERDKPLILVIDDDPMICKAFEIRLRANGMDVVQANSGTDGYWIALEQQPDAIITDYSMPDGYGNHVIWKIREHTLTKDTPLFVLTGQTVGGQKHYSLERELLSLGANRYFTKPPDFNVILTELRKCMQQFAANT